MGRYPSCTDCCTVYRMARRLGPLLFNLYTADIGMIVESHGHRLHQYADDSSLMATDYTSTLMTARSPKQRQPSIGFRAVLLTCQHG